MNLFTWCSAMLLYSKGITDFYIKEILVIVAEALILKMLLSNSFGKNHFGQLFVQILLRLLLVLFEKLV